MMPAFLRENDEIRIISPSGVIDPGYIDAAAVLLRQWGYVVSEGRYAREVYGRFSGTPEQRLYDLQAALDDENVRAILCSRGGYGLVQIIDKIDFAGIQKSPKWIIGFSDVTALHQATASLGMAGIHAIMAKHLTELKPETDPVVLLKDILSGKLPSYAVQPNAFNRHGVATGKIVGGNLSVLYGLRSTPFDLNFCDNILLIEDIAETPYHIDRMLQNLRLSGVLAKITGLIVGQFSDCPEDPLMLMTIKEIILNALKGYEIPICFDFPSGHVDYNLPVILGQQARLSVSENEVTLIYL